MLLRDPRARRAARQFTHPLALLPWGIAFEIALAAPLIHAPTFQVLLNTAPLPLI